MYKNDGEIVKQLLNVFDEFVIDFLNWSVLNHCFDPKKIEKKLHQENTKLCNLAKNLPKIKELLIRCTLNPHLIELKKVYLDVTKDYREFLNQGANKVTLCPATEKIAKELFEYFYNNLFESVHFWSIYNGSGLFKKSDFRQYMGHLKPVCPYCDAACIDYSKLTNTDHFLAQTHFPFLSVYWENLVVGCVSCNQYIKNAALIGTIQGHKFNVPIFHPYFHEAANYIKFTFVRQKVITNIPKSLYSEHARNYINVFEIDKIYAGKFHQLRSQIEIIYHSVKKIFREREKNLDSPSNKIELLKEIFKEVLNEHLDIITDGKGTTIFSKLFIDIHEYFLSPNEFDNQIIHLSKELGINYPKVPVK
jgi:hypothetical protein